jgi:uncharacterized protein YdcH (DUF465 family)
MAHTPHELHEEFPEAADKIHQLKVTDARFAKLAKDYHAVNREIHRMETGIEPVSEDFEQQKRRQRLALKDQIALYLSR